MTYLINQLILLTFFVFCIMSMTSARTGSPSNNSLVHAVDTSSSTSSFSSTSQKFNPTSKKKVLILDVDNTLYNEEHLQSNGGLGIEEQIIRKTHAFGRKYYSLTKEQCDELYRNFGSTIEGLRDMLISQKKKDIEIEQMLQQYYSYVYDGIDMSCLLPSPQTSQTHTGYSHEEDTMQKRQMLIDLLQNIPHPVYLASNSPKGHVLKVINSLGLSNVKFEGIVTPDSNRDSQGAAGTQSYPTKSNPTTYYHDLIQRFNPSTHELFLIDDSSKNLEQAELVGIKGIRVHGQDDARLTLDTAISIFLGHLDLSSYSFSDVQYLESKNSVDLVSINKQVWNDLTKELSRILLNSDVFRVVDLGAGLLSMLHLILDGDGEKKSIVNMLSLSRQINEVNYIAYESNANLLGMCFQKLNQKGFIKVESEHKNEDEHTFEKQVDDVKVHVVIRVKNFNDDTLQAGEMTPQLVVGCCFADLFDPEDLSTSISRYLKLSSTGGFESRNSPSNTTLIYFPITFAGTTQFLPPKPFCEEVDDSKKVKTIPSDTLAFRLYAQSLSEHHGHNLDLSKIVDAMKNSNGKLIAMGKSNWDIDPVKNKYLWETMMYFFASSACPQILKRNLDSTGWIQRARKERPNISVINQDLLFSISSVGGRSDEEESRKNHNDMQCTESKPMYQTVDEIIFQSPYRVEKASKKWDISQNRHLGPGQVEVKSICSLISSGTELKIFKGMFDDAALDVNIKGMQDESMKYPLTYGYSLVGVVTRCASDVIDAQNIIGRTVFTFSPHSSHAILDRDSIQIVPEGTDPDDAIFMPAVETALSIVHDANAQIGENIAIYGQGLVGLLVNAIMSTQQKLLYSANFNTLTAFDTLNDRLAMASVMGASQALLPNESSSVGKFDVSIEVSGNPRALQSAIDNTKDGGRIIVASWYGNTDIKLKLGIDFHRSHKIIKTSQVSTIPAELSTLWSKERRFALTWELVRTLKPSRLITKKLCLDEAQTAYELLDQGKEIAISFVYENK